MWHCAQKGQLQVNFVIVHVSSKRLNTFCVEIRTSAVNRVF